LAPVAIDHLSIPITSTPVERVFSTAGIFCGGRQNRLEVNLEQEVLLHKNRKYLSV